MDYFAKFKKRIAPPKVQPTSAMQLAKFHKCWEYVHNIFVMDDRKTNMHVEQTEIPAKLRQMVDLLVDEEARQEDNTTGVCMEYFLKNGVLQYLVTVAEKADYPVGIRGESIRTIASMVDLLDDRFLVHNAVHKPTIKLLRFCVLDDRQSELYSDDLVDLMYIICSKIHGFPALLNIFFHDKHWLTTPQNHHHTLDEPQDQPPEYEFLLFTYLLRFVHREGRSGDFARTGLLFIMEMANDQLGDFIFGSDFATIMAAGLGALYSQLPRKLIVKDEADQIYSNPTAFLLGQDSIESLASANNATATGLNRFPIGLGAEYSNSPEFKYQLDSFLKLLEFCQDVLTRCPNAEISVSLLNSVRTIFLENILYPSILECSDVDGSSVAVISYIDLILQTVQQEDLSKMVVGYLMDEEDITIPPTPSFEEPEEFISSGVDGIELGSNIGRKGSVSTPSHFTLKDLIFSRLKSNSQTTVIATLKLLKTLIKNHCQYSLKLLSFYPEIDKNPTIISHHLREVELYFSLIIAIDANHAQDVLACGYENYLRDVEMTIDSDWCYQSINPVGDQPNDIRHDIQEAPKAKRRRSFKYGQREDSRKEEKEEKEKQMKRKQSLKCNGMKGLTRHRIRSTDPLLQILLSLLSHFFTQSSELNLALTGVISSLALCPYRSLEGWISFSETDRTNRDDILVLNSNGQPSVTKPKIRSQDIYAHYDTNAPLDEDDEDDDRSVDFGADRESSKMTAPTYFKSYPPFFTLLRTLTQQVDYYRSEIHAFDKLLEERRNALISGETSFLDNTNNSKRIMSPSVSTSTRTVVPTNNPTPQMMNMNRRPSVLRPSISSTDPTPVLSPSSSASTMAMGSNGSPRISPNPPPPPGVNMNVIMSNPMSPLALHVRKTSTMRIQPLFPSNFVNDREEPILDLDDEDEHTFAPKTADPSRPKRIDKSTEITLSMLLNNVVILEESIKELVALMQVRRSLGIDEIAYV